MVNTTEIEDCTTNDKDENLEYHEEAANVESNIDEISQKLTTKMTIVDDGSLATKLDGMPSAYKSKLVLQNSVLPEVCHVMIRVDWFLHFFVQLLIY